MIIKYIIDTFVTPKIETLNFVDRYSSVVSEVEITTHAKGGAKTYKKYPVAAGVTATDCNNESLYQDLVPNDSKNSVIYWELTQPMQNVGKTPNVTTFNQQRYRGTARIIVWLNMAKLGFSEVAPQNRTDGKIHTLPALMKAISFEGKLDSGIYANDNVTIVPQRIITDKAQIFGKYAYSKDRNWFLYPYDFFAIDVTFTLDTCLANPYEFPLGTAINCVDYALEAPEQPIANSFLLDGVNELIETPYITQTEFERTDSFSLSIWVKFDSVSNPRILISRYNEPTSKGWDFRLINSKVYFIINGGPLFASGIAVATNQLLTTNTWYHITATYDGSVNTAGMKIYINGNEEPLTNVAVNNGFTNSIIEPSRVVKIGGDATRKLFGTVNLFRIWNKELTQAEVIEEYNSGVAKPTPVAIANVVMNPDLNNSLWDGLKWDIPDLTGFSAGYFTVNMEETDRTTDIPS